MLNSQSSLTGRFHSLVIPLAPERSQSLSITVVVFLVSGDTTGLLASLASLEAQTHRPARVLLVIPPGKENPCRPFSEAQPQPLADITQEIAYFALSSALRDEDVDAFAFLHSSSCMLPHRLEHDERLLRLQPVDAILTLPLLHRGAACYPLSPSALLPAACLQHNPPLDFGRQLLEVEGGLAASTWLLDCLTIRAAGLCAFIHPADQSILPPLQRWLFESGGIKIAERCLTSCGTTISTEQQSQASVEVTSSLAEGTPSVSVIVPCWNVERYLVDCLESIKAQTFDHYELICVDDSSSDATLDILKAFEPDFSGRMRIITHSENLGLGQARNTAIDHARGDYIASVDSDDWIEPDMLNKLYSGALESAADVVVVGFKTRSFSGMVIQRHQYLPAIRMICEHDDIFSISIPSFCNKLWRRGLFADTGIRFPAGIYYEDLATTPRLFSIASRLAFIDGCPYNYRQRNGSIMNSFSHGHISSYVGVFDVLRAHFSHRLVSSELFRCQYCNMIESSLMYSLRRGERGNIDRSSKRVMAAFGLGYIAHVQQVYGAVSDSCGLRLASYLDQHD